MNTTSKPVVIGIMDKQPSALRVAIREARSTSSPALVIVGRPYEHQARFALARPVATEVIRQAHCTIAIVPATYPGV